ncbi:nucleotidyl transferase AbiEii/AbiGii toxin family protein [Mycoplasma procyoni]|uniref:nucleotidyl transferase AbiEii/AbiGii toxin family protein n=1 Tax=Mycoplasma procyoni TaxID=568784 RepID=UPI00197CA0AD|nr:nucleotidyl transferase AbiEii/AbiGii toxin family protein [Mycoplasma procyoni]MBN3534699.1 nucleotidyl transferase AbiEii/AbiGii toxin family protein [Mycoplasma procyoni]
MDKKTLKKQNFLDFVVYRIFSSKYNKDFVLEGSKSIDIKTKNKLANKGVIYYRLPKDLDLNLKFRESKIKDIENILKDIFKNDLDIKVETSIVENIETNKFFFKVKRIQDEQTASNLEVDIILDTDQYTIEEENFFYNKEVIKVQTYNIEKYVANKIISLRKVYKENKHFLLHEKINLDNFKTKDEISVFIDLFWFVSHFLIDKKELLRNLELMYDETIFNIKLENYISYLNDLLNDDEFVINISLIMDNMKILRREMFKTFLRGTFKGILKEKNGQSS